MKILIVGLGSIGKRHAKNLEGKADLLLCDQNTSQTEDLNGQVFSDYDEALQENPDGVIIALPNDHHYKAAQKALRSGTYVLVEKPITNTLEDAKALTELSQGKLFVVCVTCATTKPLKPLKQALQKSAPPSSHGHILGIICPICVLVLITASFMLRKKKPVAAHSWIAFMS